MRSWHAGSPLKMMGAILISILALTWLFFGTSHPALSVSITDAWQIPRSQPHDGHAYAILENHRGASNTRASLNLDPMTCTYASTAWITEMVPLLETFQGSLYGEFLNQRMTCTRDLNVCTAAHSSARMRIWDGNRLKGYSGLDTRKQNNTTGSWDNYRSQAANDSFHSGLTLSLLHGIHNVLDAKLIHHVKGEWSYNVETPQHQATLISEAILNFWFPEKYKNQSVLCMSAFQDKNQEVVLLMRVGHGKAQNEQDTQPNRDQNRHQNMIQAENTNHASSDPEWSRPIRTILLRVKEAPTPTIQQTQPQPSSLMRDPNTEGRSQRNFVHPQSNVMKPYLVPSYQLFNVSLPYPDDPNRWANTAIAYLAYYDLYILAIEAKDYLVKFYVSKTLLDPTWIRLKQCAVAEFYTWSKHPNRDVNASENFVFGAADTCMSMYEGPQMHAAHHSRHASVYLSARNCVTTGFNTIFNHGKRGAGIYRLDGFSDLLRRLNLWHPGRNSSSPPHDSENERQISSSEPVFATCLHLVRTSWYSLDDCVKDCPHWVAGSKKRASLCLRLWSRIHPTTHDKERFFTCIILHASDAAQCFQHLYLSMKSSCISFLVKLIDCTQQCRTEIYGAKISRLGKDLFMAVFSTFFQDERNDMYMSLSSDPEHFHPDFFSPTITRGNPFLSLTDHFQTSEFITYESSYWATFYVDHGVKMSAWPINRVMSMTPVGGSADASFQTNQFIAVKTISIGIAHIVRRESDTQQKMQCVSGSHFLHLKLMVAESAALRSDGSFKDCWRNFTQVESTKSVVTLGFESACPQVMGLRVSAEIAVHCLGIFFIEIN